MTYVVLMLFFVLFHVRVVRVVHVVRVHHVRSVWCVCAVAMDWLAVHSTVHSWCFAVVARPQLPTDELAVAQSLAEYWLDYYHNTERLHPDNADAVSVYYAHILELFAANLNEH